MNAVSSSRASAGSGSMVATFSASSTMSDNASYSGSQPSTPTSFISADWSMLSGDSHVESAGHPTPDNHCYDNPLSHFSQLVASNDERAISVEISQDGKDDDSSGCVKDDSFMSDRSSHSSAQVPPQIDKSGDTLRIGMIKSEWQTLQALTTSQRDYKLNKCGDVSSSVSALPVSWLNSNMAVPDGHGEANHYQQPITTAVAPEASWLDIANSNHLAPGPVCDNENQVMLPPQFSAPPVWSLNASCAPTSCTSTDTAAGLSSSVPQPILIQPRPLVTEACLRRVVPQTNPVVVGNYAPRFPPQTMSFSMNPPGTGIKRSPTYLARWQMLETKLKMLEASSYSVDVQTKVNYYRTRSRELEVLRQDTLLKSTLTQTMVQSINCFFDREQLVLMDFIDCELSALKDNQMLKKTSTQDVMGQFDPEDKNRPWQPILSAPMVQNPVYQLPVPLPSGTVSHLPKAVGPCFTAPISMPPGPVHSTPRKPDGRLIMGAGGMCTDLNNNTTMPPNQDMGTKVFPFLPVNKGGSILSPLRNTGVSDNHDKSYSKWRYNPYPSNHHSGVLPLPPGGDLKGPIWGFGLHGSDVGQAVPKTTMPPPHAPYLDQVVRPWVSFRTPEAPVPIHLHPPGVLEKSGAPLKQEFYVPVLPHMGGSGIMNNLPSGSSMMTTPEMQMPTSTSSFSMEANMSTTTTSAIMAENDTATKTRRPRAKSARDEQQSDVKTEGSGPRNRSNSVTKHLSPLSIKIMKSWYERNIRHPYPSADTAEFFAKSGGISVEQVKKWFANKRMRSGNTKSLHEIALLRRKLTALLDEDAGKPGNAAMSSQNNHTVTSLPDQFVNPPTMPLAVVPDYSNLPPPHGVVPHCVSQPQIGVSYCGEQAMVPIPASAPVPHIWTVDEANNVKKSCLPDNVPTMMHMQQGVEKLIEQSHSKDQVLLQWNLEEATEQPTCKSDPTQSESEAGSIQHSFEQPQS